MATKLVFQFATTTGDSVNHTWNNINPSATSQQVNGLAQAEVLNGSIYAKVPVLIKTAKLVTTTETNIPIE